MSRLLVPIACLLLAAFQTAAQPERSEPRIRYGSRLYAELVPGLSDSADFARVDLLLRVSYDFMIFERDVFSQPDSSFRGGVDVSINLKRDGVFIGSTNMGASVATAAYTETERRDQYLLLQKTMHLTPGAYEAVIVVSDRRSRREQTILRLFTAQRFDAGLIGPPLAVERMEGSESDLRAVGYSGSLPFAAMTTLAIPAPVDHQGEWRFILERRGYARDVVFDATLQPVRVLRQMALRKADGAVEQFDFGPCNACPGQYMLFELPFDSVDAGAYTLRVSSSYQGKVDSASVETEMFWRDMPYTLNDLASAVDAMRHILTREQLEAMKDGDEAFTRQQFRRYWNERDPSPGTAYNELMTEYFRRVDQAYLKFRTLYESDGVTTDRGKVYILFGPPEETQRVMNRDEPPMEIWYYPSLSKTFRFVDTQRNGNMRVLEE